MSSAFFSSLRTFTTLLYGDERRPVSVTVRLDDGTEFTIPVPSPAVLMPSVERQAEASPPRCIEVWHSPDYAQFGIGETTYHFHTSRQRIVIQALYDALKRGKAGLTGDYLLEKSESKSSHLSNLFRNRDGAMHDAWLTLIVKDPDRTFRMDLPPGSTHVPPPS